MPKSQIIELLYNSGYYCQKEITVPSGKNVFVTIQNVYDVRIDDISSIRAIKTSDTTFNIQAASNNFFINSSKVIVSAFIC